jgi:hypothetical protein
MVEVKSIRRSEIRNTITGEIKQKDTELENTNRNNKKK